MFKPSNLQKYLRSYAEPEVTVQAPEAKKYSAAIVVPACGETDEFLTSWDRTLAPRDTRSASQLPLLVVLVVNADDQTKLAHRDTNAQLLERISSLPNVRLPGAVPTLLVTYDAFDLLVVNRTTPPHTLPPKSGVGLARKIGADVVCAWHARGVIENSWWMSTDADVTLPSDIVQQLRALPTTPGVACLSFSHVAGDDQRVNEATWAVEIELRYHALGLAYAGSNYAWPALGSCLAVHVDTYASVRGFPKRQAGEDHYLLQKATKVGPITFTSSDPVRIVARRSTRTPFGTGQSVEELLQNDLRLTLRDPECYTWLREVITRLDSLGASGNWAAFHAWLSHEVPAEIPAPRVLEQIGALDAWQRTCTAALPATVRTRRLHEWFDGLRQIQFLKGLEPALPALAAKEALRTAPFTPGVVQERNEDQENIGAGAQPPWFNWVHSLRQHWLDRVATNAAIPDLTPPSV